jgi:hypothetical protein
VNIYWKTIFFEMPSATNGRMLTRSWGRSAPPESFCAFGHRNGQELPRVRGRRGLWATAFWTSPIRRCRGSLRQTKYGNSCRLPL